MDGNVIIKAVLDTVDVSKNIKALERDLQGISWKNITEGDEKAAKLSSSFKKAGTAATVTLTAPVVAAGKAVFGVASDYEQANARIAAAFGVSGEEAERFSGIGKRIYEGGWGQSLDEVNDALIQCKSTLRDVSDEDLQTVTTNALMLSDTFGADVNESIRGTNALMEGFGLSATEASDLLTAGMQRGLNYTDELGDNLSEYSVRWGEAGMSASEYFSLLEAGTSNGAYNLDKVGDYLNEFLTALSDGRMEESIGSFSEGTQEVFENFKNGSATAEDMLQAVLGDLTQMPNEYDKAALASTLWSSLGEDNAMGMIESLAGVQDSFGDVAGAAQQAQEAASDSFAVKSQEAMRELQGSIEPLGEPLLNIATNVAGVVKSFSEWFAGIGEGGQTAVLAIATIAAAIGPVLSTVGTVVDTVPKIGAAFQVVGKLGTGALGLIAAHPVVAAIAAIIAAVVLLWNNCEEFRDAVTAVWDAVCAAFEVATQVAGDVAQSVGEFFSQLGETLGGVWDGICSTVQGAIDTIAGFFRGLAGTASSIWDGICNVVQVAVMLLGEILNLAIETLLIPWNFIWENFGEQLTAAWDAICSAVGSYIDAVSQVITDVVTALSEWWGATWEGISGTASAIWEAIYGAVSAYIQYVSDVIGAALLVIQGVWDTVWGAMSSTASSIWDAISSAIGAAINAISSTISAVLSAIQAVWDSIWGAVSSTASSVWGGISSTISSIVNGIRDTISSVFNAAKDTVSSVWNSIKSAIETPIQNARDTVRNVIDSIKGFFNFSWSLPHLKLPHLSISGSFSIYPPSVPHFGIDWYAKGGVFNGPSVIGVGEAGPEGVVPFNERGAPAGRGHRQAARRQGRRGPWRHERDNQPVRDRAGGGRHRENLPPDSQGNQTAGVLRMIYNGFDFAPWFDTRLVTRSLLPEYEIATRDVPGQPGSRFMRAELKPLTIDVAAAWRARPADDMAALRRLMASRLLCLKEAELWLDDERHLGLRYMAVLTSPGALDTLWHTGEATLTFTAYDPVAYGAEGRATVSGTSGVQAGGTFRTYPTVTVRPGGSTSALRLTNMGTGEFVQIDKAVTASSAVVIDMAAPQATVDGSPAPVTFESDFFPLEPGANSLKLSSGTATVQWTERYVG